MNWLAGASVPQDRGLALVGDPDCREVASLEPGLGQRSVGYLDLAGLKLARVVLDPSGLGKYLLKLLLPRGADGASMVKDNRARTGCPLIQNQNERHRQAIQ